MTRGVNLSWGGSAASMTNEQPATTPSCDHGANGDVEQRLLVVALPLFARRGFAGVSVREIAQEAGVTTPAVYYYFESKRGLYLRLLHNLMESRATAMRAALNTRGDAIVRLRRALEAYALINEHGPFPADAHLLLQRESFGLGGDMFPEMVNEHDASNRRVIRAILEDGIEAKLFRPVRVEHTAIAIIGVLVTFVRRGTRTNKVRPEDGITQVLDVFLEGLRLRPSANDQGAEPPQSVTTGPTIEPATASHAPINGTGVRTRKRRGQESLR